MCGDGQPQGKRHSEDSRAAVVLAALAVASAFTPSFQVIVNPCRCSIDAKRLDGVEEGGVQDKGARGWALQVLSSMHRVAAAQHEALLRQPAAEHSAHGSISSADLTSLNLWPLSLPLLEKLEHRILPSLRQSRKD